MLTIKLLCYAARKIFIAKLLKLHRLDLSFLFTLLLFFSCEQPFIPEELGDDPEGNLVVNVFQVEQYTFGSPTSRSGLSDLCQQLAYVVYDASGALVRRSFQQVNASNFGAMRFQLEPGTYQLVVIGYNSTGKPELAHLDRIRFSNEAGYSDTFLHYSTLEVSDQEVAVNVNLRRIVSLCRVVFTDPIPDNIAQMHFHYTGGSGAFDATTGLGSVNSTQVVTFPVEGGQQSTTFDLYTFLHDQEGTLDLQVTAFDRNNDIIYQREFQVPMKQRTITKLTGPFFTESSGAGISIVIGINDEWEGEQTIEF